MNEDERKLEDELNDLRHEMEHFKKEKERVRAIVGRIGGVPSFNSKIFNIIFIAAIVACLILSVVLEDTWRLWTIELATAALTVKLIYILHQQTRTNHFSLWILSSLEWRMNEIQKQVDAVEKAILSHKSE